MRRLAALFLLVAGWGSGLSAADGAPDRIVVPLSRPGQAGRLIVAHVKGSISVIGYDGEAVIVEAARRAAPPAGDEADRDAQGMKLVAANDIRLGASEIDNAVTVTSNSSNVTLDLVVRVPREFSLKLSTVDNGRIDVVNVSGEMEVSNSNGDIRLDGVSGSAVVNTFDGNIEARFVEAAPDAPMAFTTVYGKVDVAFPADVRMLAKLKSDNGRIYSDFDLEMEQSKTQRVESKQTGEKRVFLEEWTTARINGGGPEMMFKSFDGNIYLRKAR